MILRRSRLTANGRGLSLVVRNYRSTTAPTSGGHSGSMIALKIPRRVADAIAVPGGEKPEELHITLAYIKAADAAGKTEAIQRVFDDWNRGKGSVLIQLTGTDMFPASPNSNGLRVLYAKVQSSELMLERQRLCDLLDQAGVKYSRDFDYTPHVTLVYLNDGGEPPGGDVRAVFEAGDSLLTTPPTRNSFCPNGPGRGVDPTCSPGSKKDWYNGPTYGLPESRLRVAKVTREAVASKLLGGEFLRTSSDKLPLQTTVDVGRDRSISFVVEEDDSVSIGFGYKDAGRSLTETGKKLAPNTVEMFKRLSSVVKVLHDEKVSINLSPSDARRDALYGKYLSKMGLSYDATTQTWNARPLQNAPLNPLAVDPSRTADIRRRFAADIQGRLGALRAAMREFMASNEVFGNDVANVFCPTGPGGGVKPDCSPVGDIVGSFADRRAKLVQELRVASSKEDRKVIDSKIKALRDEQDAVRSEALDRHNASHRAKVEAAVSDAVVRGQTAGYETKVERAGDSNYIRWGRRSADGYYMVHKTVRVSDHPAKHIRSQASESIVIPREPFRDPTENVVTNARPFRFKSSQEKLAAFRKYLQAQLNAQGLAFGRKLSEDAWWERYVREAYKRGRGRAYDDVRRKRKEFDAAVEGYAERAPGGKYKTVKGGYKTERPFDFAGQKKADFLRESFGSPPAVERVKLLAARTYEDLKGLTDDARTRLSRTMLDGFIAGKNPREIAVELEKQIDISESRAEMISRTEVLRAHAEGQLDGLEALGVEEVGVAVEWSTSGLGRTRKGNLSPCPLCKPMKGVVLKIEEARGMIPRHPNCQCAWTPAGLGEEDKDQLDTKRSIVAAIKKSLRLEGKKSRWAGADAEIDRDRPEGVLNAAFLEALNVFCPTGPGGGVKPDCSPPGSSVEDVMAAKSGDREAMRRVVEQNQGLVRSIVKRYARRGDWEARDDLVQEGNLGLIRAVEKFDPAKEVKFSTYATFWVRAKVAAEAKRQAKRLKESVELAIDPAEHRQPSHEADDARHEIGRALKSLDARSAAILSASYGIGGAEAKTHREIAAELGITPARVGQIEKAALAKLRELQPVAANLLVNVFCPTANVFCPTGPGGGVDPSCGKGGSVQTDDVVNEPAMRMNEYFIRKSGVPHAVAEKMRNAASEVIGGMSRVARDRLAANVMTYEFFETGEELTDNLKQTTAVDVNTERGEIIAGAYLGGLAPKMVLAADVRGQLANEIYAHEFSHAIDGPHRDISSGDKWQRAWEEDIVADSSISAYALTNQHEGFAEFGRMVIGARRERKHLDDYEAMFPKCVEVWKEHGLWPTSRD